MVFKQACSPSVFSTISIRGIFSPHPLAQSASYIIPRVFWGKGCAMTLNQVFRSKVIKVIAEFCVKSLSIPCMFSPHWHILPYTSPTECLYIKSVCTVTLKFLGQRSRSYQSSLKNPCLDNIFSPFCFIWLMLLIVSACE